MSGLHRTRSPRTRLALALAAVLAMVGLTTGGVALAHTTQPVVKTQQGVTRAQTRPVPGLNRGESASFVVVDDGRSLTIFGQGRGMGGAKTYQSLLYPDGRCATAQSPSGLTADGSWQAHGDDNQQLYARYDGAAYQAVKGKAGSVSIREITSAVPSAPGTFTLTATARACAPLR